MPRKELKLGAQVVYVTGTVLTRGDTGEVHAGHSMGGSHTPGKELLAFVTKAAKGLVYAEAGDQGLGPGHDVEVACLLYLLGDADLATELVGGQQCMVRLDEAVHLGKDLVLHADGRYAFTLVLPDHMSHIHGPAETCVHVGDDGNPTRLSHLDRDLEVIGHRQEAGVR